MALLPAPGELDACYLVDLSGWARSAYEVARPAAREGDRFETVRAVAGKLVNLILEQQPEYLGFCADTPGRLWQHDLWPAYKSKRRPPGDDYHAQVARIREVLAAHRIPVFAAEGFQADDLFAAAVPRARAAGLRVVIVSRDQDLWQLLDEDGHVIAWDAQTRAVIGAAEVRASYEGIGPDLLGDLLALTGDGDEAPGIPHVGVKTAAKLLLRFRSLDAVLERWRWARPGLAEKIRDGAASARLSRELVRLRGDAPIEWDLATLRVGWDEDDAKKLRALGAELGIGAMVGVKALPKPGA